MKVLVAALTICLAAGLAGCSDKNAGQREQLVAALQALDANQRELDNAVQQARARIEAVQGEIGEAQASLAKCDNQVVAYLSDHKMAVAAIVAGAGGAGVAIDSDNEFSEDAHNVGAMVAVVAFGYALLNAEEISSVFSVINSSSEQVKAMKAGIAAKQSELAGDETALVSSQEQLAAVQAKIAQTRKEAEAVQSPRYI